MGLQDEGVSGARNAERDKGFEEIARQLLQKGKAFRLSGRRVKGMQPTDVYTVVARTRAGLVVRYGPAAGKREGMQAMFYMPNSIEDAKAFISASRLSLSSHFNTNIAPFAAGFSYYDEKRKSIEVETVHGNYKFRRSKPTDVGGARNTIPRRVDYRHGGWRVHLLEAMVRHAGRKRKKLVFDMARVSAQRTKVPQLEDDPLAADFKKAVRQAGVNPGKHYEEIPWKEYLKKEEKGKLKKVTLVKVEERPGEK